MCGSHDALSPHLVSDWTLYQHLALMQLRKELESLDERLKRLDHISEDGIMQRRQLLKVPAACCPAPAPYGLILRMLYKMLPGCMQIATS